MPHDGNLKSHLSHESEITITVIGRKSGRRLSNPIWFVADGGILQLLPVKGSDTQWYKNLLSNPKIKVEAGGGQTEVEASAITDASQVAAIVEKFRKKYGAGEIKKHYSKLDVAVTADLG